MKKRIWITWERQRRSLELARKFGCELFVMEHEGPLRYPILIIKTLRVLRRCKPDILFVQNPSMILATFACIYKLIANVQVVVDRHTTFLLNKTNTNTPKFILFKVLHGFTIRNASVTIVTNSFLASIVLELKGQPFILPDKLPDLSQKSKVALKGKRNIILISSFGCDEPIQEVLQAMESMIEEDVCLYITGNYKKLNARIYNAATRNVIFTGYLKEQEFVDLLFSADVAMALTTADGCMLCGCYEAVSAGKPLITSEKPVLMDYFMGAEFVGSSPDCIAAGILTVIDGLDVYQSKMVDLRRELQVQWEAQFMALEKQLSLLTREVN